MIGLPSWAAIAKVTGTGTPHTTNTTQGTSCAITYTPNAAGHFIVFTVTMANTSITTPSLSDNATGGTSTYVNVNNVANSTTVRAVMWYTLSVKSGATTFTASWTSNSRNSCSLVEYSGVVGVGNSATANTLATSPMTVTVLTTLPNSWVVMAGGVLGTATYSANAACSPTASCTLQDSIAGGGSTTTGVATSDDGNIASSGTNVKVQTTLSAASAWAAIALELTSTGPLCNHALPLLHAGCD